MQAEAPVLVEWVPKTVSDAAIEELRQQLARLTGGHLRPEREDPIIPKINEAIDKVGSRQTLLLFAELRKMAERGEVPFEYPPAEDGLIWRTATGQLRKFNTKNLSDRLARDRHPR